MPAAGRKRVEGGLPILSQSVAIGRASAYRSPAETEDKAPKKSRFGVPVAIGRDWSRFGVPVASRNRRQGAEKVAFRRTGRDWSRLVAFRRTGRNRSQSVAIGRAGTEDKAPKKSQSVAIGRQPKQKTRRKHKKSPIPQSGIRLHNVARRRALLAFNELLAQIHMQALEAFC